jgi:hypothetical protein
MKQYEKCLEQEMQTINQTHILFWTYFSEYLNVFELIETTIVKASKIFIYLKNSINVEGRLTVRIEKRLQVVTLKALMLILILTRNFKKASYRHLKRDLQSTPRWSMVKYFFGLNPYLICESESFYKNSYFGLCSYPHIELTLITKINIGQV